MAAHQKVNSALRFYVIVRCGVGHTEHSRFYVLLNISTDAFF